MSLKTKFATALGRTARWGLSTFTNGGSSLPGKLAQKIDPDVLKELSKNYRVVLITGTNGKTLTTALVVNILRQKFDYVLTNPSGSNMKQGIVSTFIGDSNQKREDKIAVLEVDEASLRYITKYIQPELILVTNVFRDQTDRYAQISVTYDFILEGANLAPEAVLLMNGDIPIFPGKESKNPRQYFGFSSRDKTVDKLPEETTNDAVCPVCGQKLHYHKITYDNVGDYYCINCGYKRPELTYSLDRVDELTTDSATFTINGYTYTIPVAGLYNVYNALAAYSVGRYFDVPETQIEQGLIKAERVFGRQEVIQVEGKEVRINLMKNPVGLNQIIRLIELEKEPFTLINILNDQPADGTDISWIEDGDFEALAPLDSEQIKDIVVSGIRVEDMKDRLLQAGFSAGNLIYAEDSKDIIEKIKTSSTDKIYVLATYTAMLGLRKELADKGYVKDRMQA